MKTKSKRKERGKLMRNRNFSVYMPKKLYYQMKIYQDSIGDAGSFNRLIISLLETALQQSTATKMAEVK